MLPVFLSSYYYTSDALQMKQSDFNQILIKYNILYDIMRNVPMTLNG